MSKVEIIPAVLAKTEAELLEKVSKVRPYVQSIQIDVMDGKFVKNTTVGLKELKNLPKSANYEFHWMVLDPEGWMKPMVGNHLHIIHIETVKTWDWIEIALEKCGGRAGVAINPDTPVERVIPLIERGKVERVLVMTVMPGFSAQSYLLEAEETIRILRAKFPHLDIEVDGGINKNTIVRAFKAGANKFAVASALFSAESVGEAMRELKQAIEEASY